MNSLLSSAAAALPQIKRGAHTFEWKVVETSVRCWSIALVPWVPMEIVHRSSGARRNFLGRRTAAGGRLRTTPGSSVGEERLRGQKFSAASLGAEQKGTEPRAPQAPHMHMHILYRRHVNSVVHVDCRHPW